MRALNLGLVTALSLLAGDVSLLTTASAQTTVATVPVGFTQQVIAPATDASTPISTVFSIPFYKAAVYAAGITTIDSSSAFTSSSATWSSGQFAQATAPFLVHLKSGVGVGRYFLISANTSNQITVIPRGYDLTSTAVLAAGDTFEIVPANTLSTLTAATTGTLQTGDSPNSADNVYLWGGTKWDVYYNDGTDWYKAGSGKTQNNTILYPDEGVFFTRRSTSPLTLTFTGTVPSTTERSDVPGVGTTFVSNRFPVDTTLASLGLQNLPNWLTGDSPNAADDVYVWGGKTWSVYYYDSTAWRKAGSGKAFDTTPIVTGSAVYIVRQSAATGTAATLVQLLPYSL